MPVFVALLCVLLFRQFDWLISFVNLGLLVAVFVSYVNLGEPLPLAGRAAKGRKIIVGYVPVLVVGLVSTVASRYPASSFYSLIKEAIFLLLILGLYRVIRVLDHGVEMYMNTILVAGIVASVSIIAQFVFLGATGQLDSSPGGDGRVAGIFSNPSAPGHLLATITPMFVAYSATIKAKRGGTALLVLSAVALALTQSRSGFVAFLLAVAIVKLYLAERRARLIWAGALAAGGVAALAFVFASSRAEELALVLRIANGLSGREELWERSWEILSGNAWLGIGLDSFKYEFLGYTSASENVSVANQVIQSYGLQGNTAGFEESVFGAVLGGSSHNLFIDVALSMGIFGLVAVAYFIFVVVAALYGIETREQSIRRYAQACLCIFVVYLLRAQVEPVGMMKGAISANIPLWMAVLTPFAIRDGGGKDVPAVV